MQQLIRELQPKVEKICKKQNHSLFHIAITMPWQFLKQYIPVPNILENNIDRFLFTLI